MQSWLTEEQRDDALEQVRLQKNNRIAAAEQCEKICQEFNYIPGTMPSTPGKIDILKLIGKIVVFNTEHFPIRGADLFIDKNICFAWVRSSCSIEFFQNYVECSFESNLDHLYSNGYRLATIAELVTLKKLLETGLVRCGYKKSADNIKKITDMIVEIKDQINGKVKSGQYEEAIADYDDMIRLDPRNIEAFLNRGLAKSKLGQYEDAIADYDRAIKLNPTNAEAFYARGVEKNTCGDFQGAKDDYKQCLLIKNNHDLAEIGMIAILTDEVISGAINGLPPSYYYPPLVGIHTKGKFWNKTKKELQELLRNEIQSNQVRFPLLVEYETSLIYELSSALHSHMEYNPIPIIAHNHIALKEKVSNIRTKIDEAIQKVIKMSSPIAPPMGYNPSALGMFSPHDRASVHKYAFSANGVCFAEEVNENYNKYQKDGYSLFECR